MSNTWLDLSDAHELREHICSSNQCRLFELTRHASMILGNISLQ